MNNKPWFDNNWLPGVLNREQTKILIANGFILSSGGKIDKIDHSSFDLTLSDEGYLLKKGSIKPCGYSMQKFLVDTSLSEKISPTKNKYHLKAKHCYLFRLQERFTNMANKFPIYGQATAKSSIGRLDVIARLVVDGMYDYENMDPTHLERGTGDMYLEITPITFDVLVQKGDSLSQLRLFYGKIKDSIISGTTFIEGLLHGNSDEDGRLSVDLEPTVIGTKQVSAFIAKHNSATIDLSKSGIYEPVSYWDFQCAELTQNSQYRLTIKNNEFYILRSKERISLPGGVAVYCQAMDETLGEMRIHYAGFVHPHFGMKRNDGKDGTPLIFEVRGHNVDVNLANHEKLAQLIFYRMSEPANEETGEDNPYNEQELKLSKYFKEWPESVEDSIYGNKL